MLNKVLVTIGIYCLACEACLSQFNPHLLYLPIDERIDICQFMFYQLDYNIHGSISGGQYGSLASTFQPNWQEWIPIDDTLFAVPCDRNPLGGLFSRMFILCDFGKNERILFLEYLPFGNYLFAIHKETDYNEEWCGYVTVLDIQGGPVDGCTVINGQVDSVFWFNSLESIDRMNSSNLYWSQYHHSWRYDSDHPGIKNWRDEAENDKVWPFSYFYGCFTCTQGDICEIGHCYKCDRLLDRSRHWDRMSLEEKCLSNRYNLSFYLHSTNRGKNYCDFLKR